LNPFELLRRATAARDRLLDQGTRANGAGFELAGAGLELPQRVFGLRGSREVPRRLRAF
jgi:hypothetical protein